MKNFISEQKNLWLITQLPWSHCCLSHFLFHFLPFNQFLHLFESEQILPFPLLDTEPDILSLLFQFRNNNLILCIHPSAVHLDLIPGPAKGCLGFSKPDYHIHLGLVSAAFLLVVLKLNSENRIWLKNIINNSRNQQDFESYSPKDRRPIEQTNLPFSPAAMMVTGSDPEL